MARKKQKPEFVPPEWTQIIRYKFLSYGQLSNAEPFDSLITAVLHGSMTVEQWAERYELAGTWIQVWAAKAIRLWGLDTEVCISMGLLVDGKYRLPLPDDEHTDADIFRFSISEVPSSKLALGVTRGGGSRYDDEGLGDIELYRREKHAALDRAIDEYVANRVTVAFDGEGAMFPARACSEVTIPKYLDLYMRKAAAYYFGTMTVVDIAGHPGFVTDPTNVHRQVKKTLILLGLPSRPPGHRRAVPCRSKS